MDLIINFVWIGPGNFGWLEKFMIYSWWAVGAKVNLYTHKFGNKDHSNASLDLPEEVCTVHVLSKILLGDFRDPFGRKSRHLLVRWSARRPPEWKNGGREAIFNMVDLTKSYIGMSKRGIVFDMKVGPSPFIREYFSSGAFHNKFVSYSRANVVENQCMGTMMAGSNGDQVRKKYGEGFEEALFIKGPQHGGKDPSRMRSTPTWEWFPVITAAHSKALGKKRKQSFSGSKAGLRGDWSDIGPAGKAVFSRQGRQAMKFEGIDRKDYHGPIRIFKNEWDQSNKQNNPNPTTKRQRMAEVDRAMKFLMPVAEKLGREKKLEEVYRSR